VQYEREACEAFPEWYGEVCEGVNRKVFPHGWGGDLGTPVEGRYREERPFVSCLDESWALKEERKRNDEGSLAAAGLAYGGAQATLRAANRLRYLQYETIGGRQASRARMEVGVEKKLFVVHLWTRCQKLFMPLRAV